MSGPKQGIALTELARLSQMTVEELSAVLKARHPSYGDLPLGRVLLDGPDASGAYPYSDALMIEVARQLSDDNGLPLHEALRIVGYANGARHYLIDPTESDFWLAIMGARNTWGDEPRGSVTVTQFGPNEFWSTSHYNGALEFVMHAITSRISRDKRDFPDSDAARIFMASVSAADRRLRKRAAALGINLDAA